MTGTSWVPVLTSSNMYLTQRGWVFRPQMKKMGGVCRLRKQDDVVHARVRAPQGFPLCQVRSTVTLGIRSVSHLWRSRDGYAGGGSFVRTRPVCILHRSSWLPYVPYPTLSNEASKAFGVSQWCAFRGYVVDWVVDI